MATQTKVRIRPLHDRVIVQRLEEGEQKIGGIIIPDSAKEKPQQGKVVAVGKGKAEKDGKVTPAEINTRLVKSAEAKIEVYRKEREAAFAKLDTNGDGTITKAEFEDKAKLPTIKEPDAKPFLDRFDTNKDGAISKDEFRAPTLANFDKTDKNKDGTLSVADDALVTVMRGAENVRSSAPSCPVKCTPPDHDAAPMRSTALNRPVPPDHVHGPLPDTPVVAMAPLAIGPVM